MSGTNARAGQDLFKKTGVVELLLEVLAQNAVQATQRSGLLTCSSDPPHHAVAHSSSMQLLQYLPCELCDDMVYCFWLLTVATLCISPQTRVLGLASYSQTVVVSHNLGKDECCVWARTLGPGCHCKVDHTAMYTQELLR